MKKLFRSPLIKVISITLALLCSASVQAQFFKDKTRQLLPEDEAFQVTAAIDSTGQIKVNWSIADDYYMYRDQFTIESTSATIGEISFPQGVIEDDPEFGEVEVYLYNAELIAPVIADQQESLELTIKGQGCNKPVGVCYPPMVRPIILDTSSVALDPGSDTKPASATNATSPMQENSKSFLAYVLPALFAGILLSFTPCVLPMIPILAGIIAGQQNPSKMRSGWLAICYVGGTIVTYLIAGALAGATGAQLQAYFQNIWVILSICLLLVLLAASLFGWFTIQLPSALQTKLSGGNNSSKSAAFSSFALGLISALVVGACVSPISIFALGTAITQGDPVLGAAIMGAMAFGMGLLLILFGFGAGWILPKAGPWMQQVQVVFGFLVLGVAIYLLSTLPFIPSLYLWSALLLCGGFYLWKLHPEFKQALANGAVQAVSAALIAWGTMALVGGSLGGQDILRPLESFSYAGVGSKGQSQQASLPFEHTTTLAEVEAILEQARLDKKPVLIDFYADWCLDCKRMQRTTFKSAKVASALKDWSLIEIDVTNTSDASEVAKRHFQVFGPPATLFIQSNGEEQTELRKYGYVKEADFLDLIRQVH